MAAAIPALKTSTRDSAAASSSGSWFHSLMVDGKKELLLVRQYGTLYEGCSLILVIDSITP